MFGTGNKSRIALALLLVWTASLIHCCCSQKTTPTSSPRDKETSVTTGGNSGAAINASYVQAIEDYLLAGPPGNEHMFYYNRFHRPNIYGPLTISMDFYLLGIVYTNEPEGWIGLSGVYIMKWRDERLKWNPVDFGNIQYLQMTSKLIWLPTFVHNGHQRVDINTISKITIDYQGSVMAVLNFNDDVPCEFDLTNFPRDTQKCSIHLMFEDPQVSFTTESTGQGRAGVLNGGLMKDINHHKAWKVKNTTLKLESFDADVSYPMITITVEMQRQSSFFLKVYVAPTCFLLLLMPVIFLLPPDSPEKLTYGALLLFSMIYISDRVDHIYPSYSQTMPRIVKLNMAAATMLFLSVLLTSVIASLERIGRTKPVPIWVKRYVLGVIGPYLLVRENPNLTSHGTVHVKSINEDDSAAIVENEQTLDLQGASHGNGSTSLPESGSNGETCKALQALVYELRKTRLNEEANEGWVNVFTIIDRLLFIVTMVIALIIVFCYA